MNNWCRKRAYELLFKLGLLSLENFSYSMLNTLGIDDVVITTKGKKKIIWKGDND